MSFYPPKISEKFRGAKNVGTAENANAAGTSATFVCGAVLRLTLRIDRQTKEIQSAKFKTSGCGYLIAAADSMAENIVGRRLTETHGFDRKFLQIQIENELGRFSAERKHCLELATDALRQAMTEFRALQIEEFAGERALICTCFGISEDTIENLIAAKSLATVEEVTDACNAGGGCGSCQLLIQEIIDSATDNWQ